MTDAFYIAAIASVPPTIAAVATLIVALRSGRKLDVIHDLTNSLTEKRVEKAEELGHLKGMKEESEKGK